jgi:8-oxo-dGTP diphosphatase
MSAAPILAAGAVCWKVTAKGKLKVLVVHRTQHRDVSLPKGKVEPGETLPETAVREIAEETGLIVGLGAPLGVVEYELPNGRMKAVHYWAAETDPLAIANSTFISNDEIEELTWMSIAKARKQLTYPHDVEIVERFAALFDEGRARTFAIIALRHGKAVPPEQWLGPDATRPLLPRGIDQARAVAAGVAAFRPAKLISSTATRCMATIAPTARLTGLDVARRSAISQDEFEPTGEKVFRIVEKRLETGVSTVICSHGPVLPQIVDAIARGTGDAGPAGLRRASTLATGEYAVLHIAVERPERRLVAVEVHGPAT